MNTKLELTVNGKKRRIETDDRRPLLEVLREDLGLTGTKFGCGEGLCRACTVLVSGKPIRSCITQVGQVAGKEVVTIEGIATSGELHPVQRAFLEAGAIQCGYCVPGMILTTISLLEENPYPDRDAIVEALDGNLCRCCGYPNILEAVRMAGEKGREAKVR